MVYLHIGELYFITHVVCACGRKYTAQLFYQKRVNHQDSLPNFGLRIDKGGGAVKLYGIFSVLILTTGILAQGLWLFSVSPVKYMECFIIGHDQVIPSRHA